MNNFNGKAILITGGGTGIGRATAFAFAQQGANVLIVGRSEATLTEVMSNNSDHISYLLADVTNPDDRKRMVQTVIDRYGRLDVLVNNAAVLVPSPFPSTTDEQFEQSYLVNVISPAAIIREAIPHLAETKGSVFNISATVSWGVLPGTSPFAASKAALNHLTRILATELGPMGIRVNVVAPGLTETDMSKAIVAKNGDKIVSMTPFGRLGQPEDIAKTVLHMAQAEWVTGQIVGASGGLFLR